MGMGNENGIMSLEFHHKRGNVNSVGYRIFPIRLRHVVVVVSAIDHIAKIDALKDVSAPVDIARFTYVFTQVLVFLDLKSRCCRVGNMPKPHPVVFVE